MSEQAQLASSTQFQNILAEIHSQMLECEEKGQYVQADSLRQKALIRKKQWEQQTINQMNQRHTSELTTLEKDFQKNIDTCDSQWKANIDSFLAKANKQISEIDIQNKKEEEELRKNMEQQLPKKVKESYELLNFREMERHMSKQKDYKQAHLMQQRIQKVYDKELRAWNEGREFKIEQAVCNLKFKQMNQRSLLNRRNQCQVEDDENRWRLQKLALIQRYNLEQKEMRARQEREMGSFLGRFRTKGGIFNEKYELQ